MQHSDRAGERTVVDDLARDEPAAYSARPSPNGPPAIAADGKRGRRESMRGFVGHDQREGAGFIIPGSAAVPSDNRDVGP